MGSVTAGTTMSLDGFVADRSGSVGPLYPDFEAMHDTQAMRSAVANTGAVVMGRRTFAMADPDSYVGTYEFQVPIFVLTHAPPAVAPKQDERMTFTFVTDGVESAIRQATAAAGEKDVQVVGGPNVIGQLLRAGLVDELSIDLMPVLLGDGLRLFNDESLERVTIEKIGLEESGPRTGFRFRVKR